MQLIMNAERGKYGTMIKDYDKDAYNLLKGWNKHKKTGQNYPSNIGLSFNTVGKEDVEALVNNGGKASKMQQMWSQQSHSGKMHG